MSRWINLLLIIIWCTGLAFPMFTIESRWRDSWRSGRENTLERGEWRYTNATPWPPGGDHLRLWLGVPCQAVEVFYCPADGGFRSRVNLFDLGTNFVVCSACTAVLLTINRQVERRKRRREPDRQAVSG